MASEWTVFWRDAHNMLCSVQAYDFDGARRIMQRLQQWGRLILINQWVQ
jgi:hypothetical protein